MIIRTGARKLVLLAAVAVLAVTALSASPALAAKGGIHGKGGTAPPPTVTITVSPNPVPAYTNFTVTFSGLLPGHGYNVSDGGVVNWLASDTGSVTWNLHADFPTTINLWVYDVTSGSKVLVGSITFQIV